MSSTMNFFHHQDVARRNTRLLGILFSLAVILLVSLIALLVGFFMGGIEYPQAQTAGTQQPDAWYVHWDILVASAGVALSAIGFAVLYKWVVLRPGGKVVAEHLGGRRLNPSSQDPIERKVLNVVEEMAIAANMPVPPVYMLDREPAINAFAAGYSPRDAVIGITRGCAEKLSRAQLQGVVAHEIAHILNGDMRLNIRTIAILNGILFVSHAGYLLLRFGALGGRRDGKNAALPLLGLGLLVLGAVGVLFGNIIKAAVSRQREFLADASAAQFTREPDALSGALQQIGAAQKKGPGSKIESPNADEAAHLFFGQAVNKMMSVMATHPPLEERIRRLEPSWDGTFRANQSADTDLTEASSKGNAAETARERQERFVRTLAGAAAFSLPETVIEDARDPEHAKALVLTLLLHDDDADDNAIRQQQLAIILQQAGDAIHADVVAHIDSVKALPLEQQLPLCELVMPALKMMDAQQTEQFLKLMQALIDADAQTTLYEWCLYQVIWRYLQGEHSRRSLNVRQFRSRRTHDAQLTLSVLAHFGHDMNEQVHKAFAKGAEQYSLGLELFAKEALNFSDLSDSLSRIDQWTALEKERLVNAWVACTRADGVINPIEQKLLFTLCACIGEPLPELPA